MAQLRLTLLSLLCAAAYVSLGQAQPILYSEDFAARPVMNFSGGSYKASNSLSFPASDLMSGALFTLKAGGLREQHWHQPNEWGIVISGVCRATLVTQKGATRPSDSWDFETFDSWFFPSNQVHSVLGLGPTGCQYLTAYDMGPFDELYDGIDMSAWVSATAPGILAQGLGVDQSAVEAAIPRTVNGFIAQGNGTLLTQNQTSPPLLATQAAPLASSAQTEIHRIALGTMAAPEVDTAGAVIRTADITNFPAATAMSCSLVLLQPGAMRQLHWHVESTEWEFSVNASVVVGVFNQTAGEYVEFFLGPGDLGVIPAARGHYIKNVGETAGYAILIYNTGLFTNVEVETVIAGFPAEYFTTALGTPPSFVNSLNFTGAMGAVPQDFGMYNDTAIDANATQPENSVGIPTAGPATLSTDAG